jgi:hypothetical protein
MILGDAVLYPQVNKLLSKDNSVRVVKILWELIVRDKLQPKGGRPEHLLWMLYFLKVYPKQGPGCLVVGASAGAVDPKTHRKWVWAFIEAIAELVDCVVSNSQCEDGADCCIFVMTACDSFSSACVGKC